MAKHTATVTVNAPMEQTYRFWSHFNDYPKFMSFVKEVTYIDDQRSHWVVDLLGRHEWDAVNEGWVPNESIGWRSTDGLENAGKVNFRPLGYSQTQVDVTLNYDPPAGFIGDAGEALGGGARVQDALEKDLANFARMVEQAGPGALDPESSNYLFHADSAAAKGETTEAQNQSMQTTSAGGSSAGLAQTLEGANPSNKFGTGTSGSAFTETGAGREDQMASTGYGGEGSMDEVEEDETSTPTPMSGGSYSS